ncbi:MAG: HAD family phosphatase [Pseudomonadota bacterium]
MIKHIVFDVGRVLLHWDPELPYRRLIPDPQRRAWFLSEVCSPAWNREQDRGRGWPEAEAVLIAERPEEADLIRAYRRYWNEMVPYAIEESCQVLASLVKAGMDVTLLTNFHQETFEVAKARFPFLSATRGATVSGEVALLKPERAIYDHHTSTFGLDPDATLFFDDTAENVDGAKAAGWRAHLFTTPQQMRADLAAAGVAV